MEQSGQDSNRLITFCERQPKKRSVFFSDGERVQSILISELTAHQTCSNQSWDSKRTKRATDGGQAKSNHPILTILTDTCFG